VQLVDWAAKRDRAVAEHALRLGESPNEGEREDLRLGRIAGSAWAAGLASRMVGDEAAAAEWLGRAADEYATSWEAAPAASWGRPIAVLRCRLMAGDAAGARTAADAALDAGALEAPGAIAGYCAALALLAAGRDGEAVPVAARIVAGGLEPASVGEALAAIARGDDDGLATARREVLRSFEERDAFLEDVPVADTVLVLDALARERGLRLEPLPSALLP
jgi:hypothetical protein